MAFNSITTDGLNAVTAVALQTTMRLLVHDPNSLTNPKLKRILLSELLVYLNSIYFNLNRTFLQIDGLLTTGPDGKLLARSIETEGAIVVTPTATSIKFSVTPGNVPPAEDNFSGSVRVNTSDPLDDPVVYRVPEVDSLIAGLAAVDTALGAEIDQNAADIVALQSLNAASRLTNLEAADAALDGRLDVLESQTLDDRLDVYDQLNIGQRLNALEGDWGVAVGVYNSMTAPNNLAGFTGALSNQATISGVSFSANGFCSINQPGLYIIQIAGPLNSSATTGNHATFLSWGLGMQSNGAGPVTDSVRWAGITTVNRELAGAHMTMERLELIPAGNTRLFQALINNNALNGTWGASLVITVIRLKRF